LNFLRKHFKIIDSTNSWAKRNKSILSRDQITLITAEEQTAGRGRLNRKWNSPPSQNIYATFALFLPEVLPARASLPQILALCVCDVLEGLELLPRLKWPNDILIGGKKVGGILTEAISDGNRLCLLLGLGLNVNMPLEGLQQIDQPATSLKVELGRNEMINLEAVLSLIQEQFSEKLNLFLEKGFAPFFQEFEAHLSLERGKVISFQHGNTRIEGKFHSFNQDGSLSLILPSGAIQFFFPEKFCLSKNNFLCY
jgi:BirA family biotin operon repressor/biotin-[acetyl-CoA-carboxylase] ligase